VPTDDGPARRITGDEVSGDDRARGRADESLAIAQVKAGRIFDSRQDAHHPGLAEHAAATEHEHNRVESARSPGYP